MAKTNCPVTQKEFMAKAGPVTLEVAGSSLVGNVKAFSTGSFGWYVTGKAVIMVDGKPLSVQIGANLTVVGSKEAARE